MASPWSVEQDFNCRVGSQRVAAEAVLFQLPLPEPCLHLSMHTALHFVLIHDNLGPSYVPSCISRWQTWHTTSVLRFISLIRVAQIGIGLPFQRRLRSASFRM